MACNLLLYIPLIVQGRWTPLLRRLDIAMGFVTCLLLVWVSAAGNIFAAEGTDQFVKFVIGIIVLVTLLEKGFLLNRELHRGYSPKLN